MKSAAYKCLLDLNSHSTAYIKTKWERVSGMDISEEEQAREYGSTNGNVPAH